MNHVEATPPRFFKSRPARKSHKQTQNDKNNNHPQKKPSGLLFPFELVQPNRAHKWTGLETFLLIHNKDVTGYPSVSKVNPRPFQEAVQSQALRVVRDTTAKRSI